ncbi:hypothetical protein N7G274_004422 [Stereocaulon virgatum]|uniref:Uncharacterized protein n=1 Tax=Stereocaulon virgatum TaxID=373712 RepID=A0ABR4AC67_9LECA
MESGVTPVKGAEKSDILKQLSQRPPRLGGFTRFSALESWAEFSDERNFGRIRQYLLEPDPAPVEDTSSKPIASKHFLKGLFRSHSDRKSSRQSKKMSKVQSQQAERKLPVVAQRTSYGGKYGQIVTNQVYDVNKNASTYQINVTRGASTGKQVRKPTEPATDNVSSTTISSLKKVTGFRRPIDGAPVQQASDGTMPTGTPSPYQTANLQEPTLERLATKADRCPNENFPPGSSISQIPKPLIDVPLQPVHHANESFVVSRKEYPHLLLRDDKGPKTPRASRTSIPKSESQPTIRDFAPNGRAQVQRAKAARARSRSPAKRISKQKSAASSIVDIPIFPTFNGQSLNSEVSTFPITDSTGPDSGVKSQAPPPTTFTHRPIPSLQPSPIAASSPKAPSIISAESLAEDLHSNTSSVVVSDAHIATLIHNQAAATINHCTSTPPQPGPAPTKALPSLPEGQTPMTPTRLSESSYRMPATPERSSPTSPVKLPQRSPARYRFTPVDRESPSPPKRIQEPVCINAVDDTEQVTARPANEIQEIEKLHPSPAQGKKRRRAVALPKPEGLPESLGVDDIDHITEKAKAIKARDLARMKSQKAEIEDVDVGRTKAGEKAVISSENEEEVVKGEGPVLLPSPPSFDESAQSTIINPIHLHPSQLSGLSISTTFQGDSSMLPQKLSPIMVLAEQEPITVQRTTFQKSRASTADFRQASISKTTNGLCPFPSKPLSPTLHFPDEILDNKDKSQRPLSAHSMPPPNTRPATNRVPTPLSPSLLSGAPFQAQPTRSSLRDPGHDVPIRTNIAEAVTELEARVEAVERKNCMLERAFLAVLDAGAGYGSIGAGRVEIGALGAGLGGGVSEQKRASGTNSLHAGLGNLLAVHSGDAGAPVTAGAGRLSTSSVP